SFYKDTHNKTFLDISHGFARSGRAQEDSENQKEIKKDTHEIKKDTHNLKGHSPEMHRKRHPRLFVSACFMQKPVMPRG
ncbi:MAG: hypothetical protein WD672_01070, partial [Woeseia sp.]